jgi:flavorubredoxin
MPCGTSSGGSSTDDRRYYFDCLQSSPGQSRWKRPSTCSSPLAPTVPWPRATAPWCATASAACSQDYRLSGASSRPSDRLRVALLYASAYGNTAQGGGRDRPRVQWPPMFAVEAMNCEVRPTEANAPMDILSLCDGFIIGSPTLGGHAPVQIQTALG